MGHALHVLREATRDPALQVYAPCAQQGNTHPKAHWSAHSANRDFFPRPAEVQSAQLVKQGLIPIRWRPPHATAARRASSLQVREHGIAVHVWQGAIPRGIRRRVLSAKLDGPQLMQGPLRVLHASQVSFQGRMGRMNVTYAGPGDTR